LTSATLTTSSDIVGATGATLTVTLQNVNTIPFGGYITLQIPYWNSEAVGAPTYYHMLSTSGLICVGVTNLIISLSCTYSNDVNRNLNVTNLLGASIAPSTTITFTVNNFINPYNNYTKSGFILTTYSAAGCAID
jgi:hypothetical protein